MIGIVDFLLRALLLVPALLIAIPVHEMGHAIVAYFLGDRSVRYFGYLRPDPRRFLEPIGVIAVFLALVGWGRRVPVQPNRITTTGQKLVYELAGPVANLAVAIVVGRIYTLAGRPISLVTFFTFGPNLVLEAIFAIAFLNLSLFAFNLLPIPGLDGWNVIEALFGHRNARFFFEVSMQRRQIWFGAVITVLVFQFLLGLNLLSIVMTPFFEPASLISMNTCVGYRIPNLTSLSPCLP